MLITFAQFLHAWPCDLLTENGDIEQLLIKTILSRLGDLAILST